MNLSKEILKKQEFGDITLIHKITKLSRPTITKAFQGLKITRNVHKLITEYYQALK
jgi:hypothetical protein